MTERKLKEAWRTTAGHLNPDPSDVYATVNLNGKTTLERLAARYRRFSIVGVIAAVMVLQWSVNSVFDFMPHRTFIVCFGAVYLLLASLLDHRLYLDVKAIDPATMSVSDVIMRCLHCRKRHLQCMAVLIPLAIVYLGLLGYGMARDPYFLSGMVLGAIVGLAIGVRQLMNFMSDYRSLTSID